MFQIGLIDAIPYGTASVFALSLATFADWLIIHDKLSVTQSRKMLMFVSLTGTALGFIVQGYIGCDYKSAALVIIMTVTVNTAATTAASVQSNLII